MRFLHRNNRGEGLGLLRIGFGLMLLLAHGWPTLKGLLAGAYSRYPDPLGLGSGISMALMTFAEFFCALLVVLGFYTRLALIPLIIGFATAFFIYHAKDTFGTKELAFHYLLVFIVLFISGPGRFTIHDLIRFIRSKT